ncbi:MAG: hypothetical protein EP344_16795 [Bacteroidetes bacterium]|nr:MAG: hypothetical protein EP344_16795 [Bacteroidota bacterium]
MLQILRTAFFDRLMRQTLAKQNRRRQTHTIDSAHSIGILFDATNEKDRNEVLEFANTLKEAHLEKKVRLLGFVDIKNPLGQTLFPQFTQKELRWNGQPSGETVDTFLSEKFDLLLCLNGVDIPPVAWIAAAAPAAMKIGTHTDGPNDFDLMLETPAQKGIQYFVDQLDLYLEKIVPSGYESTAAL